MNHRRNSMLGVVGVFFAGAAVAGTVNVLSTPNLVDADNLTVGANSATITTRQTTLSGSFWQRDRWTNTIPAPASRLVQLDLRGQNASNTSTEPWMWSEACLTSANIDGGSSYFANVEVVNGSNWVMSDTHFNGVAKTAAEVFTEAGGSPGSNYGTTGVLSLRSAAADAGSVVDVPSEFSDAATIRVLTMGAHNVASNATLDYTFTLTFENIANPATTLTKTFTIPIKDARVVGASRNNGGLAGTSTTGTPGESVAWTKTDATFNAANSTNRPGCTNTEDFGDEIVIDNPADTFASLQAGGGYVLAQIAVSYTELDPSKNTAGAVGGYLGGPIAVSLEIDANDYDDAFVFRGLANSPGTGANTIDATPGVAGSPNAWWYQATFAATYPSDTYSDVYLELRCGEDSGGSPLFSGPTIDLTPNGLRALGASGTISFANTACDGEYAQVFVEAVSAFDLTPTLTGLSLTYDIDADGDGVTAGGLFKTTAPRQIFGSAQASLTDCNDLNASAQLPVATYIDADADGDGTGVATQLCPDAIGSRSLNAQDCNDSNPAYNRNGTSTPEAAGNGLDFNCDGNVLCYVDSDQDGEGSSALPATLFSGATNGGSASFCDSHANGRANNNNDCNDGSQLFNLNNPRSTQGTETPALGLDYTCDTLVSCYTDGDNDTYGTSLVARTTPGAVRGGTVNCSDAGWSVRTNDCNDADAATHPGATDVHGTGVDRDCEGTVRCFLDGDNDGDGAEAGTLTSAITVGLGGGSLSVCQSSNRSTNTQDCNDGSALYTRNNTNSTRGTESIGSGLDYDCDDTVQCFLDADQDTYGAGSVPVSVVGTGVFSVSCAVPASNRAAQGGDCEDTAGDPNPAVFTNGELYNPGRGENDGEGFDYNCSGTIRCILDDDDDTFGTTGVGRVTITTGGPLFLNCNRTALQNTGTSYSPSGQASSSSATDCNDDPAANGNLFNTSRTEVPGAGIDYNCSTSVACFNDADRDGEGATSTVLVPTTGAGGAGGGSPTFCDRPAAALDPSSSDNIDCNDVVAQGGANYNSTATEPAGSGIDFNCDRGLRCFQDSDRDGFGSTTVVTAANAVATAGDTGTCDVSASQLADDDDDCDDAVQSTYPGATEPPGTETDRNCDGEIVCYQDSDGDTWGSSVTVPVPVSPSGGARVCANFSASNRTGDCQDLADPFDRFRPDSTEEAVGGVTTDYNCDGTIHCFLDNDEDGQGTTAGTRNNLTGLTAGSTGTCQRTAKRSTVSTDCDDADDDVYLGNTAAETANLGNGIDQNCDATIRCFVDEDDDGYGSTRTAVVPGVVQAGARVDCNLYGSAVATDCLDCFNLNVGTDTCLDNAAQRLVARGAHPGGNELLDGSLVDENCDNRVACYPDDDRDGFGDEATNALDPLTWSLSNLATEPVVNGQGQCLTGQAHAANGEDCHDDRSEFFPGATHHVDTITYQRQASSSPTTVSLSEIPGNAFDDDCDGVARCFYDQDQDGFGVLTAVNAPAVDFREWAGTRQPAPGMAGSYDRMLGGTYTCAASRQEAPLVPGPVFDCNDTVASVFPGNPAEADGVGIDNNCDATVFCFIDADGDGFGGSTSPFPTPGAQEGYISGVDGPALCTTANGFADNGTDCHDNNQFAYPRLPAGQFEVAGHSPLVGQNVNVPGVGLRVVGNGPGQYDYCGDGSDTCYGKAFDDDCDDVYDCFLDEDGDGYGTDLVHDPYPVNAGATPTLTCSVPTGSQASRRAPLGGAPGELNRDCHPLEADAYPGRAAGEVTGNVYDDNCDNVVACYADLDDDGYGVNTNVFITWVGLPTVAVPGYQVATGTFHCDDVNDMASLRGSQATPLFDCHDNYQYANPGVTAEVPGHTPAQGATVDVAGVGTVTVGTGPGQYDLCGDGGTACYGVAIDEDCNNFVQCYVDTDGDGVGGQLTTTERGIVAGSTRPWDIAGVSITPYTTFTCDTTSAQPLDPNRRSSIGGNVGQASHDCNDGNSTVYPTTTRRTAPSEQPGHTTNPSDVAQSFAFDENCDGFVLCFEDQDQDGYGTIHRSVPVAGGAVRDATAVGSLDKRYDCETLPGGTRSQYARRGGARNSPYFNPSTYDCHDNNAAANPGITAETPGRTTDPLAGPNVAFDENCDGIYTCYRDRDADGYGTDPFGVSRDRLVVPYRPVPGGSADDDGVYTCELASTDLSWAPGVDPSPLTGRGGGTFGGSEFDCHDRNPLANPGVAFDPPGNSDDDAVSTALPSHGYDDNCDNVVECYQNSDGDLYGTFVVTLTRGATSSRAGGTIALSGAGDWFDCDSIPMQLAGYGGESTANFDCHDDSSQAYPSGPTTAYGLTVAENPRDAYDNDCTGGVDCFEDRDNDGYGTRVVSRTTGTFPQVSSPAYNPAYGRSPADAGMRLYICGVEAASAAGLTLTSTDITNLNLNSDGLASIGGKRGTAFEDLSQFDCHDDNPAANPGITSEVPGRSVDPLSGEVIAFDENCDGIFTCYRDRDDDGFGTNAVSVDRLWYNNGSPNYQIGGSANDDGIYTCDLSPPSAGAPANQTWNAGGGETHLAGVGGGSWAPGNLTFDCHDTNANAYPTFASGELAGDAVDSSGDATRSYDDDCDGTIACYRDLDGDGYGTYVVNLARGASNNNVNGTIALVGANDWFDCDVPAQTWAGRGGFGNSTFDCHDDNALAFAGPSAPASALPGAPALEVDGDAYDNDCNGLINCFIDLDNDSYGTLLQPIAVNPSTGLRSPTYNAGRDGQPATSGLLLYPCGETAAAAAGLVVDDTLRASLNSDRRAERGGVGSNDFDCHDDWSSANPGVAAGANGEVVGDPFDNNCDGVIQCWADNDGDGFGFSTRTANLSTTLLNADVAVAQPFASFPFDVRVGGTQSVLPSYPLQAFPDIVTYRADTVEQAARVNPSLTQNWYDCRGVVGATPVGGDVSNDFHDCHDEADDAFPGFVTISGQLSLLRPQDRRLASGPSDATCDGPVMCVNTTGPSVAVFDATYDDRTTGVDECVVDGGAWRCFESADVPNPLSGLRSTDPGEVAGDEYDNDCDGLVLCYQDLDSDDVGTVPVVDSPGLLTNPLWYGPHYTCTNGREAEFTGDCHDHVAAVKPAADLSTAAKGDDVSRPAGQSPRSPGYGGHTTATGWDDPTCGSAKTILCYDPVSDRAYDRYAVADCAAQFAGGQYVCYAESVGDALDQNCDGVVGCFYDADGDAYGVEGTTKLANSTNRQYASIVLVPGDPAVPTADPGTYVCGDPANLSAGIQRDPSTSQIDYDCNDTNFFESPAGIETIDLFVGILPVDRQRAFNAVGNTIDEDCDENILCWVDADGDTYGAGILAPGAQLSSMNAGDLESAWDGAGSVAWPTMVSIPKGGSCNVAGLATRIGDCHDNSAVSNPASPELPGDIFDNDCNGIWQCYQDLDRDGYGSPIVVDDVDDSYDATRTCNEPARSEADDNTDCLDNNQLTATVAFPQGQRYPISPLGVFDPSIPFQDQPTVAYLSHPSGLEVYGDGFDSNCDGAELCFVDQDQDGFVDGRPTLGVSADPLGRVGNVVPVPGTTPGVIACQGVIDIGDGPRLVAPWPLDDVLPSGVDPFWDGLNLVARFDCNDTDEDINPSVTETYYDGTDSNCDNRSDFDRDLDGYDDRGNTQERVPCPTDPGLRFAIDPVVGCGIGTDCNDQAAGAAIHPAPYDRSTQEAAARALPAQDRLNPASPVARYPEFDPADPLAPATAVGIRGNPESCESGSQVDSDCDGNVNTHWDCYFDIWAYDDQLDTYRDRQEGGQLPWGQMSREYFTRCIQPYESGLYFVDRRDPLDYTAGDLDSFPATLAEANQRYDGVNWADIADEERNFLWLQSWDPPANAARTRYYADRDLDGEGDADAQGVLLCDLAAEDGRVVWLTNRFDCNDENETINLSGKEICDRIDNNCNGQADEASLALTPELDPTCVYHYIDGDADSWGMQERYVREGTADRYCLCPRFEALVVQPDGTVTDKEPPQDCEHFIEGSDDPVYGHRIGGVCYSMNSRDCDDLQPTIKPFAPGQEHYELIDGVDNDCDGRMPLIELDCDDDNAYPYLPVMTQALLDNPSQTPITNFEEIGLAECGGAPPNVLCFGGKQLPLACDDTTGLWVVRTEALEEFEKFSGASRLARQSQCSAWDCDDSCASRCAGLDEKCDGIDNDCNAYAEEAIGAIDAGLIEDDADGVPDVMQAEIVPLGRVQPSELDLDGDEHITCAAGVPGRDNQTAITDRSCRQYGQFNDCNDLCVLQQPSAEEAWCNGFDGADQCTPESSESDGDGDRYRTCGAFGEVAEDVEKIYTLVFSKGDVEAYLERPDVNKLDAVVPLIPPRRYEGGAFADSSVDGQIRECDLELASQIEAQIGPLPSGDQETREAMLDLCVRTETCRVLRERIAANSGDEQVNEHDTATVPRSGQSPAPPVTGINVLPDYCEELVDARCSVVELTLASNKDSSIYEEADAWRDALPADDPRRDNACVLTKDFGEVYHPEQAITRTVWSREQIVATRKLVVEYECFRMFGTFGCEPERFNAVTQGDPAWRSPFADERPVSQGFFRLPDVPVEIFDDRPEWWMHVNRFIDRASTTNVVVGGGTLVGCWGDPTIGENFVDSARSIGAVGGDCKIDAEKKDKFEPSEVHRGAAEGPGDLMARYLGVNIDCGTCLDGVDNNCNGQMDQEEPACAQCFVGQGYGCGCSAAGRSGSVQRSASALMALTALMAALARRRERT